jgi:hypothetical protein
MVRRSRLPKGTVFSAEHRLETLPMMFFASWYKSDVSPNLTKPQKEVLLKKISEASLRRPIFLAGQEFSKKEFPELAPYAHTKTISGLQLYAVMNELVEELHPAMSRQIGKPYSSLPF